MLGSYPFTPGSYCKATGDDPVPANPPKRTLAWCFLWETTTEHDIAMTFIADMPCWEEQLAVIYLFICLASYSRESCWYRPVSPEVQNQRGDLGTNLLLILVREGSRWLWSCWGTFSPPVSETSPSPDQQQRPIWMIAAAYSYTSQRNHSALGKPQRRNNFWGWEQSMEPCPSWLPPGFDMKPLAADGREPVRFILTSYASYFLF